MLRDVVIVVDISQQRLVTLSERFVKIYLIYKTTPSENFSLKYKYGSNTGNM